jgi:Folate-dependent phosphoribosylglycinamide formyltransferase PurN
VTKKVAIFISGSGSNMVSLVNSMYKQNYAWPSLVLSNKSCASGISKAKNFNIPTVCIEPKKASGIDLDFEAEIQRELKNCKIELICLAGFMRLLSSNFVDCWKGKY